MKDLYAVANISKQGHLASVKNHLDQSDEFLLLSAVLKEERGLHPAMSLKKLYHKLNPGFVGRDAFVNFGMLNGFEPFQRVRRTRHSDLKDTKIYPNLLHDLVICDVNRLWVSDITYFKIGDQWFYITFIEDVYSRKILGWQASDRMFATANVKAFEMALEYRVANGVPAKFNHTLIHHSDKGSQYRSSVYTDRVEKQEILISTGNCCYDNAFMESLNGIMKNEYLKHRAIHNFKDLIRHLKQDVHLYNYSRPHGSLKGMTPDEFERYISNIPLWDRTAISVFTDKKRKNNLLHIHTDAQQLTLPF